MTMLRTLFLLSIIAAPAPMAFGATHLPPVILITIDTLRADHLPMWGAKDIKTPNLESLAGRSVLFEQAVTCVPLTLPAHTSLMTGTYPHYHQVRDNSATRLSAGIPTLATILKQKGYSTAAFVASAVLDRRYGLDQGFDTYGDQFAQDARFSGKSAERQAEAVIGDATRWLNRQDTRPFFVWVHLYDPHAPYQAPGKLRSSGYRGEIEYVDQQLGLFFRFLKKKGWDKKGVLLVLSDHGEDLSEHGEPAHGFFAYDTVLRIPFMLKFPHDQYAGIRVKQQVRIIDVFPTLLQILKIPIPKTARIQGTGLLSHVLKKSGKDLLAYAETIYPRLHFGWSSLFVLRTGAYKFIEAPTPELYDLKSDPGETKNIFPTHQGLGNQLREKLKEIRARYRGTQAEKVTIDPQQRERLLSLGYLSGAPSTQIPINSENLPDPKDKIGIYAQIYKGMQAFVEEDFESSLRYLIGARKLDDSTPLVHDYIGRVYSHLHRPQQAIQSYREALRLSPGDYHASVNLAYAYLQAGEPKAAAEGLELVLKANPTDWQSWHLLGVSRFQLKEVKKAEEAFRKAVDYNPTFKDALFNLGMILSGQKRHTKAVDVFRRLVVLDSKDAAAWGNLATQYEGAGMLEEAEKAYQSAIAAGPTNAKPYFNYGNFFARRSSWGQAEEMYRRVIELDRGFARAYLTLAVVLEKQGKTKEAEQFRRAGRKQRRPM